MSTDLIEELNDIVAVLRGGAEFYSEAAEKVERDDLKALFAEHAAKREAAVADLSAELTARGEEPAAGSWAEKAHEWYAAASAVIGDADKVFLDQLEEHEDRTLEALRDALEAAPAGSDHVRSLLHRHLETFQETHDRMLTLKKSA